MKASHDLKISRVIESCKNSEQLNYVEAWVNGIVKDRDKRDWFIFKIGSLRISFMDLANVTKIELYGMHAQNYLFQELLKFRVY